MKRPQRKTLIASATVLVLSLGSVGTYFALDHFASADKSTTSSTEAIAMSQLVKPLSAGFKGKTPAEDLILFKFYFGDGFPWLSEFGEPEGMLEGTDHSAASNVKPQMDENLFISAVGNFASLEQLNVALSFLGKTKAEIQAANTLNSNSFEIAYNKDKIVDSVSININPSTPEQILQYVGQPVFTLDNRAFLYHGQNYDFIIHTTNGAFFNKMTIRPVRKQNNSEQPQQQPVQQPEQLEQPQPELPQEQEQVQPQQPVQPNKQTQQKPSVKTVKPKQGQSNQQPTQPQQPAPVKEPVVTPEPPKDPVVVPDPPQQEPTVDPDPPREPDPDPVDQTQGDGSSAS